MKQFCDTLGQEFFVFFDINNKLGQGFEEHFVDIELWYGKGIDSTDYLGVDLGQLPISGHLSDVGELKMYFMIVLCGFHIVDVI